MIFNILMFEFISLIHLKKEKLKLNQNYKLQNVLIITLLYRSTHKNSKKYLFSIFLNFYNLL